MPTQTVQYVVDQGQQIMYDPGQVTYMQAPEGQVLYEVPQPARFNISPEMFQKLMAGHPVTEDEIQRDAVTIGGALQQMPQMPTPELPPATADTTMPTTEAAASAIDGAVKKAKKSKKAKVSKKKKGCC